MVAGLFLLSLADADTSLLWVNLSMLVLGIGLGNCMQPLLLIMQSSVPPTEIGVATSSATFFRQIGGTMGVAVFLSVLFAGVGTNIADAIKEDAQTAAWQQTVRNPDVLADPLDGQVIQELAHPTPDGGVLAEVQDDSSIIDRMDPVLAHPFKEGFAESMALVFRLAAGVGVVGFFILLLLPAVELRATSASVAARAEADAAEPPI
jgi:hypothetical protein